MHAALLKYKPGTMRRWIEKGKKGVNTGDKMVVEGGPTAFSLVIYMKSLVEITELLMGWRLFCTTVYR